MQFDNLCPVDSIYSFWLLSRIRRKLSLPKLKGLSLGMSKSIVSKYNLNFIKDPGFNFIFNLSLLFHQHLVEHNKYRSFLLLDYIIEISDRIETLIYFFKLLG